MMPTFEQIYTPVADSLVLSTLVAIIPIAVLFILLAVLRVAAHWSSLVSLALALVIAVLIYGMPVSLALNSTLAGAAFGLFPIVWIVINAIFVYNVIVDAGYFDVVRNSLASLSNDRRIQVVLIAFILGALLEATAGFGTPGAITAAIMAGLGVAGLYAAGPAPPANNGPGRVRGFRHPHNHGGFRGADRHHGALADGGAPDAASRGHHSWFSGRGDGRVAQDARGLADHLGQRRVVRRDTVPRLELHRTGARGPSGGYSRGRGG